MSRIIAAISLGLVVGFFAPRQFSLIGHAASTGPYQQFAGTWYRHGGDLKIDRSGHGSMSYRTYQNCSATIVTACDYFDPKGIIYDGGFAVFYLWKVQGNQATGSVTNSAYSYQVSTTLTLVRNANDTMTIRGAGPDFPERVCGPAAPAGYCGA